MKVAAPPGLYRAIARRFAASDVVRTGAVLSMTGGLLWVLSGLLNGILVSGILPRIPGMELITEAISVLAITGVLGGVAALHARQSPSYGWSGRLGFVASMAGSATLLVGLPISSLAPESLDPVLVASFWGVILGLFLLGAATLRLGFLPQWCGVLLVIFPPLALAAGEYGGGVVFGILWITLGYALLSFHDLSAIISARGERT